MSSFITVKEFAALANVTTQAVYKRISQQDNTIQQYIKIDGKYKLISTDALKLFAEENTETPAETKTDAETPENTQQKSEKLLPTVDEHELLNQTTDKLVSSLENHISDLKNEIETLRNELAEKNMQINNLNERLANEQELHRHNQQQLLLVSTQETQKEEEPEKPHGFFKKLFNK